MVDRRNLTTEDRVARLEVGFDTLIDVQRQAIDELNRKIAILEAFVDANDEMVLCPPDEWPARKHEINARIDATRDAIDWKPKP